MLVTVVIMIFSIWGAASYSSTARHPEIPLNRILWPRFGLMRPPRAIRRRSAWDAIATSTTRNVHLICKLVPDYCLSSRLSIITQYVKTYYVLHLYKYQTQTIDEYNTKVVRHKWLLQSAKKIAMNEFSTIKDTLCFDYPQYWNRIYQLFKDLLKTFNLKSRRFGGIGHENVYKTNEWEKKLN